MKGIVLAGCALLLAACGGGSGDSDSSSHDDSDSGGESFQMQVSTEPELGGTVSHTEFLNLQSGDVVTVTASPEDGYEFAGWFDVANSHPSMQEKLSDDLTIEYLVENAINRIEARFSLLDPAAPVSLPPEGSYALFAADNARDGLAFVVTEEETIGDGRQGLWRTEDGGQKWEKAAEDPVEFVEFGFGAPGYIVAGYDVHHLVSSNQGETWSRGNISSSVTLRDAAVIGDNIYLASSGTFSGGGLYRSQDGGELWTRVFSDADVEDDNDAMINTVSISPEDPSAIFVGPRSSSNIHRSSDGGDSWFSIQTGLSTESSLLFDGIRVDPQNADNLFVRNNISVNGGANWTQRDGLSPSRMSWLDGNLITIEDSMVRVSEDFGDTWRDVMPLSTDAEIPIEWPDRIYVSEASLYFHGSDIEPLYRINLDSIREQIN